MFSFPQKDCNSNLSVEERGTPRVYTIDMLLLFLCWSTLMLSFCFSFHFKYFLSPYIKWCVFILLSNFLLSYISWQKLTQIIVPVEGVLIQIWFSSPLVSLFGIWGENRVSRFENHFRVLGWNPKQYQN